MPFDVLVVDHSTSSRNIISSYLSSAGIKVTEAASPEEAMKALAEASKNNFRFTVTIVDESQESFNGFELSKKLAKSHAETAGRIVVVASFDEKESMEKAVAEGVAACLVKPLRRTHLLEVVLKPGFRGQEILSIPEAVEAGLEGALDDLAVQSSSELDTFNGSKESKWKVLLAEDNPVLQQLAERQLRKFGLDVVTVANGQEAVLEFDNQNDTQFDAIFMDCQMPELDGYEATVEIRRREEIAGGRVPIVAMTAGAMPSDRERCIRSGMDDYLSKPVGQEQLRRVIASWIPLALNAETTETRTTSEQSGMSTDQTPQASEKQGNGGTTEKSDKEDLPINLDELRKLYGDDDLHDILKMFLSEATELLTLLREQIDSRSDRELAGTAHQLKGLSAVLCADNLTRLSVEIEQSAKRSAWEPAEATLVAISEEFKKVKQFVNDYLRAQ